MQTKRERDARWANTMPYIRRRVEAVITLVENNQGMLTTADIAATLGIHPTHMQYVKRLANMRLWDRGLCVPKPRSDEGWVWWVTNDWDAIRDATSPMMKYHRTLTETIHDYLATAHAAPAFARNTAQGRAVNRMIHALENIQVVADDMRVEMDALIP